MSRREIPKAPRCLSVETYDPAHGCITRAAGGCNWTRATRFVWDVECEVCKRSAEYAAALEVVRRGLADPDQIRDPVLKKNILKRFLTV